MKSPSQILREGFLEPLHLNAHQLSKGLHVNRSTIARLLNGTQRITPDMASRLATFFSVPARWWLLMQAEFDAFLLEKKPLHQKSIVPMKLAPDVLLTPQGVLHLDDCLPCSAEPSPTSLSIQEISQLPVPPDIPLTPQRDVRTVHYDNGAVALIGDD